MSESESGSGLNGRIDRHSEREAIPEKINLHSITDEQTLELENDNDKLRSLPSIVAPETVKSIRISKRNMLPLFVVNIMFVVLFYMFGNFYNSGVVRTLERRFGLSSAQTGLLQSSNDIVQVCIIVFIGYFGRTGHKPRIICCTAIFSGVAGFFMASPHFLLSSVHDQHQTQVEIVSNANTLKSFNSSNMFCSNPAENRPDSDRCDNISSATSHRNSLLSGAHPAYYIFLSAQFISGVAGSGIHALSVAYIDENVPESKSSFYIGILISIYAFGPFGGMMIAALSLRLPENLLSPAKGDPSDPSWIGCWWFVYLICASGLSLSCIPLWFFPKSCKNAPIGKNAEAKEQHETNSSQENIVNWARQEIVEFPRRLLNLLRNRAFLVNMFEIVCNPFIMMGVFVNLVRYIEIHFLERAFVGSLIAGLVSALAGATGSFSGGFLVSRLKLRPPGAMKIVLFSDCSFITGLIIILFLGCPQLQMAGRVDRTENRFTVITDCNQNCACSETRKAYSPVCGSDNLTYFSACMAGCKNFSNGMYSGCSCIGSSTSTLDATLENGGIGADGFARPGLCRPPCNLLVPFAVALFLTSLVAMMARVPLTMVNLRIVGDDERSFALSLNSFAINLLGFVPAPLLFGSLIDWTCKLWQTTTCKKTGSCLLYDTDRFRYVTYGVALLFKGLSFLLAIVLFLLVRKMVFTTTEEKAMEVEVEKSDKQNDQESPKDLDTSI